MKHPATDKATFELFLLSRMRCKERVAQALRQFGYDEAEMSAAAESVSNQGLERPGVRIDRFERFLGASGAHEDRESKNPYQQKAKRYSLQAIPQFDLVVSGDARGFFGGLRFERKKGASATINFRDVRPWETVEHDLLQSSANFEVVDEWYPMKDFRVSMADGSEVVLRFDFGLLQMVISQKRFPS